MIESGIHRQNTRKKGPKKVKMKAITLKKILLRYFLKVPRAYKSLNPGNPVP
jgi:hypothetical protein